MDTTTLPHSTTTRPDSGASRLDSLLVASRAVPESARGTVLVCGARGSGQEWLGRVIGSHPLRPDVEHLEVLSHTDIESAIRAIPHAKPVHVIRDGRDVVAACALAMIAEANTVPPPVPPISPDMARRLAAAWARSVHGAWIARDVIGADLVEVRYERLRAGTPAHVEALLEALGLEADEDMIALMREASAIADPDRADWREHFTNDAKAAFKSVAGALLIELGYERDTEW